MSRWRRFRSLFGLEPSGDVDDELSFHVEMLVKELVARGETPERARELARRRFGDYDSSRDACVVINERRGRRMLRTQYFSELRQDIGYALRMLRRTPGFTLVAVATLALGIGATSAIFSVVHGVLLASLPFRNADELYRVRMLYPDGTSYSALSAPDFLSVKQDNRVFQGVEAYATGVITLVGSGDPREAQVVRTTDGLFELLGLPMALGRTFLREEHQVQRGTVAILDHGFWTRAFGGDSSVLNRTVDASGRTYTIVGVLAPGAKVNADAEIYVPLEYDQRFSAQTETGRRSEFLAVVGRARPGIRAQAIEADLKSIGASLQKQFANTNDGLTFNTIGVRELLVGDVRTPLLVLMGAVAFVLLVACANVANLLLARSAARQGELAVRAAIGAGRARLFRQLLTESILLGLTGGALGLALAYWGTRALVAARPADIPRLNEIGVSGPVILFTLAAALLTSLIFGVLPAMQSTGRGITRGLHESGRSGGGAGRRLRSALVVAEMALAVILLTGAGLLIRSFVELTRVEPGFRTEQAMTFRVSLDGYRRRQQIFERVTEIESRVRSLPGVVAVAGSTVLPLSGLGSIWNFAVEGAPPPPPDVNQEIAIASITPDYFKALGTPLQRGRLFSTTDNADAPPVAIVNEAAVRRWFNGQDPLGRRVVVGADTREIVGVVGDVLQRDPGQAPVPQLFAPYAQVTTLSIRLVVRTANDPLSLVNAIRNEIRSVDPKLAITSFTPLEQLVSRSVARPRFYTELLLLFAAIALLLAATGIFGLMSYTVAQRSREISIRMALGAKAGDMLRMIVGHAMLLATAGAAIGIGAALALGRVIQQQLFGVSLLDPPTLAAVVLVLALSATAASFLPARRASRLDPAAALRES
jgi:putative ABC transport system permease protein